MYIRKRGKKYSFTIDVGADPVTNKRRQKTVSGFPSPKEAEKAAAEMITELSRGNLIESKVTLKEFMSDFMDNQVKHAVAENTYFMQKGYADNHIYPVLGNVALKKITPMHIQKFYSQKIDEGLSAGMIQNLGVLLGKVFRAAQEWGMINKNVVQQVRKPTYRPKQMKVWTQEEVNKFLKETQDSRFHVVYLLALTTGMRKGEILGLQWKHIDFQNATISVQQTIVYANKKLYLKEPKTAKSRRLITIPEFVVSYLRRYKIMMPPNELDTVAQGLRQPLAYPATLEKVYYQDLDRVDVPRIRFHDMRHTHATILLKLGLNPKVVQERLGHTNIATTLNTYSHVLPSMQKDTAEKLNEAFKM